MTSPKVERWRDIATEESRGLPVGLILALIHSESGGEPGVLSGVKTREYPVRHREGRSVAHDRAMGLMQVIPSTAAGYNDRRNFGEWIYYDDLVGTDENSARLQIRMGVDVFLMGVKSIHNWDSIEFPHVGGEAGEDHLKLAILAYRMGAGATRKRLDKLRNGGEEITFGSIEENFPDWGLPNNRPIHYTKKVWALSKEYAAPGDAVSNEEGGGKTGNEFFQGGACCCRGRRSSGCCPLVGAEREVKGGQ